MTKQQIAALTKRISEKMSRQGLPARPLSAAKKARLKAIIYRRKVQASANVRVA